MAIQWRIQDLQISGGGGAAKKIFFPPFGPKLGGGGGGGGAGHKNIFSSLRASVWAKYKGGPKDAIEPHTTYT